MASSSNITPIKPEFGHVLRIWWAWTWRSILLGLIVGIVVPILFSVALMGLTLMLGGTREAASVVSRLVGYLLSFGVQVYVLWSLLYKGFGQFAIRLVEPSQTEQAITTADFLSPTVGDAIRIWWAWFWRTTAVSIGVPFIISIPLAFLGTPPATIGLLSMVLAFASYLLAGLHMVKVILRKKFKKFRIRLVSTSTL